MRRSRHSRCPRLILVAFPDGPQSRCDGSTIAEPACAHQIDRAPHGIVAASLMALPLPNSQTAPRRHSSRPNRRISGAMPAVVDKVRTKIARGRPANSRVQPSTRHGSGAGQVVTVTLVGAPLLSSRHGALPCPLFDKEHQNIYFRLNSGSAPSCAFGSLTDDVGFIWRRKSQLLWIAPLRNCAPHLPLLVSAIPIARRNGMFEDDGLWPCKCEQCEHEWYSSIAAMRADNEARCPDCSACNIIPPPEFNLALAAARAGRYDFSYLVRISPQYQSGAPVSRGRAAAA